TEIGVLAGAEEGAAPGGGPAEQAPAGAPPRANEATAVGAAQPSRQQEEGGAREPAMSGRVPVGASAPRAGGSDGAAVAAPEPRTLSPAVRKLMRENDVSPTELARVAGSGIAGRVTRDDLIDYLQHRHAAPA